MKRKFSKAHKDEIATKIKDSWSDPTKRVEQKKRIEAKKLLNSTAMDRIESADPLNIETARQALIDEIKKLDDQVANVEPLVQRRDKLSGILQELNNLRERQ